MLNGFIALKQGEFVAFDQIGLEVFYEPILLSREAERAQRVMALVEVFLFERDAFTEERFSEFVPMRGRLFSIPVEPSLLEAGENVDGRSW